MEEYVVRSISGRMVAKSEGLPDRILVDQDEVEIYVNGTWMCGSLQGPVGSEDEGGPRLVFWAMRYPYASSEIDGLSLRFVGPEGPQMDEAPRRPRETWGRDPVEKRERIRAFFARILSSNAEGSS